jgi:hypothetical protein
VTEDAEVVVASLRAGSTAEHVQKFFQAAAVLASVNKAVSVRFVPRSTLEYNGPFGDSRESTLPARLELMALKA